MVKLISTSLLGFLALTSVHTQVVTDPPCHTAAFDGIVEVGCWGYSECINGIFISHECPIGQVLDKLTKTCGLKGEGHTECDKNSICSINDLDVMIADRDDHCRSYYRCYGGVNIGQFYCPASLIFNEEYQTCDYPANVVAPCGVKPRPTGNVPIIITKGVPAAVTTPNPGTGTTQALVSPTILPPVLYPILIPTKGTPQTTDVLSTKAPRETTTRDSLTLTPASTPKVVVGK